MSKKVLFIIGSDFHLKESNLDIIEGSIKQGVKLSLEHNAPLILNGDILDNRKSQSLTVLYSLLKIKVILNETGTFIIPGNHDKTDYQSNRSFLDIVFDHVISESQTLKMQDDIIFHFLPFFKESSEIFIDNLNRILKNTVEGKRNFLFTHIAVNGVRNNDGSIVKSNIDEGVFEPFEKVFIGHYHDQQEIGKNIWYHGSIIQHNYGEDNEKGWILYYDDGSWERIKTNFKEFKTIKIDLEKQGESFIKEQIEEYKDKDLNIRFKFEGKKEDLVKINTNEIKSLGIDVKSVVKNDEVLVLSLPKVENISFDSNTIKEEYKSFCDENEFEKFYKEGLKYLNNEEISNN